KMPTDFRQRSVRQLAAQKHGDLPGKHQSPLPPLGPEFTYLQAKMLGDSLLNPGGSDPLLLLGKHLSSDCLSQVLIQTLGVQRWIGSHEERTPLHSAAIQADAWGKHEWSRR